MNNELNNIIKEIKKRDNICELGICGIKGAKGKKGEPGTNININSEFNSIEELKKVHPIGKPGDIYIIHSHVYYWDNDKLDYLNGGFIGGEQGNKGNKGLVGISDNLIINDVKSCESNIDASIIDNISLSNHLLSFIVPEGIEGIKGIRGLSGLVGEPGKKGETGPKGPSGDVGPKGKRGATGPKGAIGNQGPIGVQGNTGKKGLQGDTGPTGLQGARGDTGLKGESGSQGSQVNCLSYIISQTNKDTTCNRDAFLLYANDLYTEGDLVTHSNVKSTFNLTDNHKYYVKIGLSYYTDGNNWLTGSLFLDNARIARIYSKNIGGFNYVVFATEVTPVGNQVLRISVGPQASMINSTISIMAVS